MTTTNNGYFFCYSPRLKQRLLDVGERFICVGINEKTGRKFWLFPQTNAIGDAVAEHKADR